MLADAGIISSLLPMLSDKAPAHMPLVSATVKILENLMDFNQNASTTLRDLDGLHLMIERLAHEAGVSFHAPTLPTPFVFKLSRLQAEAPPPPAVALPYPRKVLIKFLLRTIAISSYAPTSGNGARPSEVSSGFERALALSEGLFLVLYLDSYFCTI